MKKSDLKRVLNVVIPLVLAGVFAVSLLVSTFSIKAKELDDTTLGEFDTLSGLEREPIDWDADYDGDGLLNKTEYVIGTDINSIDSDNDGLSDYYEHYKSKTSPLKSDTDEDGIDDGAELDMGLNPRKKDSLGDGKLDGERSLDFDYTDEGSGVSLSLKGSGNLSNVTVQPTNTYDDVSGLVSMYNLFTQGNLTEAEIVIPYDEDRLEELNYSHSRLKIYYFDPVLKTFTEVESRIDEEAKTVTATVQHFSHYALADSSLVPEKINTDIFFVLDNSGSMFTPEQAFAQTTNENSTLADFAHFQGNDPEYKRVSLPLALIERLDGYGFRFGAGKFTYTYSQLIGLNDDATAVADNINALSTMKETFDGTYVGEALYCAVEAFDYSISNKYAILLTDGEDSISYGASRLASAVAAAKAKNIKVIIIALGDEPKTSVLSPVATQTGGLFYRASNANILDEIFRKIMLDVNYGYIDTDGDGEFDHSVIESTGFIPSVNGFSFHNYGSLQSKNGNCYGMATFAQKYYNGTLPSQLDEARHWGNLSSGFVEAQGYDLSSVNFFKNNAPLYDFKISEELYDFHNSYSEMVDVESTAELMPLKPTYKNQFENLGYIIEIVKTGSGTKFEKAYIDINSTKLLAKEQVLPSVEVLKAIYRLFIMQYKDKSTYFSSSPDAAYQMLVEAMQSNDPLTIIVSTKVFSSKHAINAIGLLQDIYNPDKFIIEVYDNNYPNEIRYIHTTRTKIKKSYEFVTWFNDYSYTFTYEGNSVEIDLCQLTLD